MEMFSIEEIQHEVLVLKQLDHLNITKLVDYGTAKVSKGSRSKDVFFVALELAKGGELFDFIATTGAFDEKVARYFFRQLIEGLEHLHENGMSHRDLKSENILFDKEFNLKVADFGYASTKGKNSTIVGTEDYMAPEVLKGTSYSGQAADIFGAGLILFVMVTRSKPFLRAEPTDQYYKYMATNRPKKFWNIHEDRDKGIEFSKELKSLINSMFAVNPFHRPSISEIKENPWYNGEVATHKDIKKEFKKRKKQVDEEKKKEEDPDQVECDPDIFKGKVHRDIADDWEDLYDEDATREVMEYDPEITRCTKFFSTSKLEDLWNFLAVFINDMTTDYKFSNGDYSVKACVVEEEKEEAEGEGTAEKPVPKSVEFTVHILKVPDEDKY